MRRLLSLGLSFDGTWTISSVWRTLGGDKEGMSPLVLNTIQRDRISPFSCWLFGRSVAPRTRRDAAGVETQPERALSNADLGLARRSRPSYGRQRFLSGCCRP